MPRKKKTEEKIELKAEAGNKDVSEEEKKQGENLLVPLEEYKKAGISLGTRVITAFMKKYIFKRRPDGLATINTNETDSKLKMAINLLSNYNPSDIVFACKREKGWKGLELLGKLTGANAFTKKYPAGVMTNPNLPDFFEPSVVFVSDPWLDKAVLSDAIRLNLPVISLCDTNNITLNLDLIIPCNNKSGKSLGLVFYIIARELIKKWNLDVKLPPLEDFVDLD